MVCGLWLFKCASLQNNHRTTVFLQRLVSQIFPPPHFCAPWMLQCLCRSVVSLPTQLTEVAVSLATMGAVGRRPRRGSADTLKLCRATCARVCVILDLCLTRGTRIQTPLRTCIRVGSKVTAPDAQREPRRNAKKECFCAKRMSIHTQFIFDSAHNDGTCGSNPHPNNTQN